MALKKPSGVWGAGETPDCKFSVFALQRTAHQGRLGEVANYGTRRSVFSCERSENRRMRRFSAKFLFQRNSLSNDKNATIDK